MILNKIYIINYIQSCYDVPPTCFGFYKAIIREAVHKGIIIRQILSKV